MEINEKKVNKLFLYKKNLLYIHYEIEIDNVIQVSNCKYVGVNISMDLNGGCGEGGYKWGGWGTLHFVLNQSLINPRSGVLFTDEPAWRDIRTPIHPPTQITKSGHFKKQSRKVGLFLQVAEEIVQNVS